MKTQAFCWLFVLGLVHFTHGQNAPVEQAIEVDPVTGLISKDFPFDKSFYVKLKIDKTDVVKGVNITRVYGPERMLENPDGTTLKKLDTFYIKPIKDDKKKKNLIALMPPLAPNALYDMAIWQAPSGKYLKQLLKLLNTIDSGFGPNYEKLENAEHILDNKLGKKLELNSRQKKNSNFIYYEIRDSTIHETPFLNFYRDIKNGMNNNKDLGTTASDIYNNDEKTLNIVKEYLKLGQYTWQNKVITSPYRITIYKAVREKLEESYQNVDSVNNVDTLDIQFLNGSTYQKRITKVLADARVKFKNEKLHESSIKILSNFRSLDAEEIVSIVNGDNILSFDSHNWKPVEKYDLPKRIENAKKNVKLLSDLVESLKLYNLINGDEFEMLVEDLTYEIIDITEKLENKAKAMQSIIKQLQSMPANQNVKFIKANSKFDKISDEAGKWILPDFGLVFTGTADNKILRPFIGANINFGPVDKNVRTRFMSNTLAPGSSKLGRHLRQHLSLMLGISIGTIEKEGKRKDLFNSINVMTGLGYRFNRSLRLSTGAFWYNKVDANPIISNSSLDALGYISLSFDIDFKKAGGDAFNKVF